MNKTFYFLGILLLSIGLFWLHSSDLMFHLNEGNDNHEEEVDLKFALLGLIPTLAGLYFIERYNKNLSKTRSNINIS